MPYRITQCYLPPGRGDIPYLTPAESGTRLSDPGGMPGWIDLVGWLHIPRWYTRPNTVTHPSTNRARRALTSFMRRKPLTTTQRHLDIFFVFALPISITFCYLDHLVANRMSPSLCLDPCRTRRGRRFQAILCHNSSYFRRIFGVYAVRICFF